MDREMQTPTPNTKERTDPAPKHNKLTPTETENRRVTHTIKKTTTTNIYYTTRRPNVQGEQPKEQFHKVYFRPKKNLEAQRKKFAQETTPTELENMPSNK
jgi:hypothetical protein